MHSTIRCNRFQANQAILIITKNSDSPHQLITKTMVDYSTAQRNCPASSAISPTPRPD